MDRLLRAREIFLGVAGRIKMVVLAIDLLIRRLPQRYAAPVAREPSPFVSTSTLVAGLG